MIQKVFPMKIQQIIVIALTLAAGGAGLSAMSERPLTAERSMAVAEPDFAALHRQASDALDDLRRAPESRRAPMSADIF